MGRGLMEEQEDGTVAGAAKMAKARGAPRWETEAHDRLKGADPAVQRGTYRLLTQLRG
jgi:hypothetical protein